MRKSEIFEQDTSACLRAASIRAKRLMAKRGVVAAPKFSLRASQSRFRDAVGTSRTAASLGEDAMRNRLYSECMHRLGYSSNES